MAHLHPSELSHKYLRYYEQQSGGALPVFRGTPIQGGQGLGDIFRSVARFLLPIVAPILGSVASKFVTTTSEGLNQGHSFRESAKGAIGPTLSAGLSSASEQVMNRISGQSGSGRKRKAAPKKKKNAKKSKWAKGVFKGTKSKKKKSKKNKKNSFRVLPTNF